MHDLLYFLQIYGINKDSGIGNIKHKGEMNK